MRLIVAASCKAAGSLFGKSAVVAPLALAVPLFREFFASVVEVKHEDIFLGLRKVCAQCKKLQPDDTRYGPWCF